MPPQTTSSLNGLSSVVFGMALHCCVSTVLSAELKRVFVFTTPAEKQPSVLQWTPDGVQNEYAVRAHASYGEDATKLYILHSVAKDGRLGSRLLILDRISGQTLKSLDLVVPKHMARLSLTMGSVPALVISSREKVYSLAWESTGPLSVNWVLMAIDSSQGGVQRIALPDNLMTTGFGPERVVLPEGILFVRKDGTCVLFKFINQEFSKLNCDLDPSVFKTSGDLIYSEGFGLLRRDKMEGSVSVIGKIGGPATKRTLIPRGVVHVQTGLKLGTEHVIACVHADGGSKSSVALISADGTERWSKVFSSRIRSCVFSSDCDCAVILTEAADQGLLLDRKAERVTQRIDIGSLCGGKEYLLSGVSSLIRIVPGFSSDASR